MSDRSEAHGDSHIIIPPAALEAAVRAMWKTDDPSQWELGMARAACLAMLEAWPWKKHGIHHRHDVSIPFVMLSMAEVPNDND